MNIELLIHQGNEFRSANDPQSALSCYAQAFMQDTKSAGAYNNFGNVLREIGNPRAAIPFIERAIELDPDNITAKFNLSVAYLLAGDYQRGWPQYEHRWNFEHLAGTLPNYDKQSRWSGQDLKDRTILVVQEQGLGDTIQFCRFLFNLHHLGAKIILHVNDNLLPLFYGSNILHRLVDLKESPGEFDYWIPMMSIPGVLGITLDNLGPQPGYIAANSVLADLAAQHLGPKTRKRVGICWSGRTDTWINRHKGMPLEYMLALVNANPDIDWINLQVECSQQDQMTLGAHGVRTMNRYIKNFSDTAAFMHHLDLVISVDTAIAHLGGALGLLTCIPLSWYGTDWRWLTDRDDCAWYDSARLYRQPKMGDWTSVIQRLHRDLQDFKNR